jgi:hypothetical protein
MKILPTTCGIFVALVFGGMAARQDKNKNRETAIKPEQKCLIGVWKLVSCEGEGNKMPEEILKGETVRWTITATTIAWTVGKDDEGKDKYALDPTTEAVGKSSDGA